MEYREILETEARRNRVRVYYHNKGAQWGRAGLGTRTIYVPTPRRFPSFFTCLHELGHVMSKHHAGDGKPEYLWEYQAFNWALLFCKTRGIVVPERTIVYERNIIAEKARRWARRGGRKVDVEVTRFIKAGSDDDPDVAFFKKSVRNDGTVSSEQG